MSSINNNNNNEDSFAIFLEHYQTEKNNNNNNHEAALTSAARAYLAEIDNKKKNSIKINKNDFDDFHKIEYSTSKNFMQASGTPSITATATSTTTTTTSAPPPPIRESQFVDGDIAMMVFATAFVMLMTPAAGVAQAGQIRRKNALSMLMQTLTGMCIGSLLWYIVGFALVFGDSAGGFIGNPFGSIGWFLRGVSHLAPNTNAAAAADTIPGLLMCAYQLMFAIMTPVIVTGAWAERMSFEAFLVFITVWPFAIYYPLAHWLWNASGFLAQWGVQDFAGGIVIHTSAGIAALAVVLVLTKRKNHQDIVQQHHNLPLSTLGAVFIWGGWYSFNGGSAYKANFQAASALLNTHISACSGGLTWVLMARIESGHWPLSAVINGVFAGLSGITAGSGFVPPQIAVLAGFSASVSGYFCVKLRQYFNLDDVCEVIALQGVPGAVGAILVGLGSGATHYACNKKLNLACCTPEGSGCGIDGVFAGGGWKLFGKQIAGVVLASVWAFVMTYIVMIFIKYTVGIEVTADQEEKGLDVTQIGERAYDHDLAGTGDVFSPVSKAILAQDAEKLCLAARTGDLVHLHKLLLFSQASAKSVNYDLRSPAHLAAAHGHLEFLKELHRFGCGLDCVDRWGNTPMSEAITHGNDEVIAWLISKGINATSITLPSVSQQHQFKSNDGTTLIRHTEEYFLTKITNTLTEQLFDAASIGDTATLRRLIAAGIDVNAGDYDKRRALHLAAAEGFCGILELLIDAGADAAALDRWGHVALEDAKTAGFDDCVEFLKTVTPSESRLIELRRQHNQKLYGGRATESLEETMRRNASEMVEAANVAALDQTTPIFPGGFSKGTPSGEYGSMGKVDDDVQFYSRGHFADDDGSVATREDDDAAALRKSVLRQSFAVAAPAVLELRKEIRQKPRKAQIKERMKYLMMNQFEKKEEEKARKKREHEQSLQNDDDENEEESSSSSSESSSSSSSEQDDEDDNKNNKSESGNSDNKKQLTDKSSPKRKNSETLKDVGSKNSSPNNKKSPSFLSNNNNNNNENLSDDRRESGRGRSLSFKNITANFFGNKTPRDHNASGADDGKKSSPQDHHHHKKDKKSTKKTRSSFANARDATDAAVRELCTACGKSNLNEVERLLKKGADPTRGDYDGRTPLHIAAVVGNVEIMRALLESNPSINVNVLDRWQRTPLQEALFHNNPITAQHLRKAGGTVVQRKTGHALCLVASRGDLDSLKQMQESGVDLLTADYDSRTALHLACCNGFVKVVQWLLTTEGGFRDHPSPIDRFGNSPMVDCIREKQTECFNLLVEATQPTQSVMAEITRENNGNSDDGKNDDFQSSRNPRINNKNDDDDDDDEDNNDEKDGSLNASLLGKGKKSPNNNNSNNGDETTKKQSGDTKMKKVSNVGAMKSTENLENNRKK